MADERSVAVHVPLNEILCPTLLSDVNVAEYFVHTFIGGVNE